MKVMNKSDDTVAGPGSWKVTLCPIGQVCLTDNWTDWLHKNFKGEALGSTTKAKNDTCFMLGDIRIGYDRDYGCILTAVVVPAGILLNELMSKLHANEEFSFTPRIIDGKLITFDLDVG